MKVGIVKDEWYPVYTIEKDPWNKKYAHVPDHVVEQYEKAIEDFNDVQDMLRYYFDNLSVEGVAVR